MKGNPDFGFKEARPASRSLWLLPGNTRIREENRAQVAVLMHFLNQSLLKNIPVSIVIGNCGTIVKIPEAQAGC